VTTLEIFGLGPCATENQVCKAWRVSVRNFHPDKIAQLADAEKLAAEAEFKYLNNIKDFIVEQIRLN
jgi:curved DNA-binding protein CbpA